LKAVYDNLAPNAQAVDAFKTAFEAINLQRPTRACTAAMSPHGHDAALYRRYFKLKAHLESSSSYVSFTRLVPGAFNRAFIG
jgi:hypothetical protein